MMDVPGIGLGDTEHGTRNTFSVVLRVACFVKRVWLS